MCNLSDGASDPLCKSLRIWTGEKEYLSREGGCPPSLPHGRAPRGGKGTMRGTARARRSARVECLLLLRRRDALYTRCYANRLRAGSERRENHNALFTLRMNCVWWGCVRASVGSASRHSTRRAPLHTGLRGRQAEAGRTPADTCRDTWLGRVSALTPHARGGRRISAVLAHLDCAHGWGCVSQSGVRCCLAPRHAPPPSRAYVDAHTGEAGSARATRARAPAAPPCRPDPAPVAHTRPTRDTADGVCARRSRHGAQRCSSAHF